jgi:hypothetical protein
MVLTDAAHWSILGYRARVVFKNRLARAGGRPSAETQHNGEHGQGKTPLYELEHRLTPLIRAQPAREVALHPVP